jgi:Flp pilus assembly pilin Flp
MVVISQVISRADSQSHAQACRGRQQRKSRTSERGQATVEYVGLAVAVAVLLVSIGGGLGTHGDKLGDAVAKRLTQAVSATN